MTDVSRAAEQCMVTALTRLTTDGRPRIAARRRPDRLAAEEPMEIRVGTADDTATTVTVTMRTPGHDFELAVGFLLSEGVLSDPSHVRAVMYCERPEGETQRYNVVTVRCASPVAVVPRMTATSSSCGICGTATLEALQRTIVPLSVDDGPVFDVALLLDLPERLCASQRIFATTGGLHAAGIASTDGTMRTVREDVGRHNAVDKVIGFEALSGRLPLTSEALVVSGRASFEIVQKAAVARIPILIAVSAPSSLAVAAAEQAGITLVGFARSDSANVYTYPERISGLDGGRLTSR